MDNQEHIEVLRNIIYENLDHLITGNYCLLDYPNHCNLGDHLIWHGELAFLKRYSYTCNYVCSYALFDKAKVNKKDMILLHGGGNFGDLYRPLQEFRLKIVNEFPANKIVFFPQTIFYKNESTLDKDLEILNNHQFLTVCVRDLASYNLLKNRKCKFTLLLVPDMAFCLQLNTTVMSNKVLKKLFLKRTDNELALHNIIELDLKTCDIQDWPTYNNKVLSFIFNCIEFLSYKLSRFSFVRNLINNKTGFIPDIIRRDYVNIGTNFIDKYDEIYTDRLHGCILALLLNKKVTLLDNTYGKNSGFYYTWLSSFENVSLLIN